MSKHVRSLTALIAGLSLAATVAVATPANAAPVKASANTYTIRASYPSGSYIIKQTPVGTATTTALVGSSRVKVPNTWRVTVTDAVTGRGYNLSRQIASTTVDFYTAQYLRQRFTSETSVTTKAGVTTTVGSAPQAKSIYRGAMFTAKYAAKTLYERQVRIQLSQHDATRLLNETATYLARHPGADQAALNAASKQLSLSNLYTGTFTISAQAGVTPAPAKSLGGYRSVSVRVTSDVDAVSWRATAYASGVKQLTLTES